MSPAVHAGTLHHSGASSPRRVRTSRWDHAHRPCSAITVTREKASTVAAASPGAGSAAPGSNAATTMMRGRTGRERTASVSRIRIASRAPPWKPASSPTTAPTTVATNADATPMANETRAPWARRTSTSRPSSSVPSRCPGDRGGSIMASRWMAVGETPTSQETTSASNARRRSAANSDVLATAPRWRTNRRHAEGDRARALMAPSGCGGPGPRTPGRRRRCTPPPARRRAAARPWRRSGRSSAPSRRRAARARARRRPSP